MNLSTKQKVSKVIAVVFFKKNTKKGLPFSMDEDDEVPYKRPLSVSWNEDGSFQVVAAAAPPSPPPPEHDSSSDGEREKSICVFQIWNTEISFRSRDDGRARGE